MRPVEAGMSCETDSLTPAARGAEAVMSAAQNLFFQSIGRSPDEKPGRTAMRTRQNRIEHDAYRRARHCAQG